jgi:pyruvate/2-oxoglutarate dehydrogenase complex dihydrolipoamide acyltransferase (E2) component
MDLTKIIAINGKPGLHRVIGQSKQALIVESLADGKRFPVPLSVRVNSLGEISMFTTGDDVPLKDVLVKVHEANGGGEAADPKSDDGQLWEALLKALPTADRERIYPSDVRKLFTWYAQLLKAGEFIKKEEEPAKEAEVKEVAAEKKPAEKAPKKKAGTTAKVKATGSNVPKAAAVRRGGQRGA